VLGSAIVGEALAVDCPISGQVMDKSAQPEVPAVVAVSYF
jgi:hypothetical protein